MIQLYNRVTGARVVGTYERVEACALVIGFMRRDDGTLEPDYEGITNVWWETSETVTAKGEPCYVDENEEVLRTDEVEERETEDADGD